MSSVVLPKLLDTLQVAMPPLAVVSATASFDVERAEVRENLLRKETGKGAGWHERLAFLLIERGEFVCARGHAQRAIELAATDGGPDSQELLIDALRTLALVEIQVGAFDAARDAIDQLDAIGHNKNPRILGRFSEVRGFLAHSTAHIAFSQFFEAESRFRSAIRSYEAVHDLHGQLRSRFGLARSLAGLGYHPASVDEADEGLQLCVDREAWRHVPSFLLIRALSIRDTGIHTPTRVLFEEAIAWAEALGNLPILADAWQGYGMLLGYDVAPSRREGLPEAEAAFARSLELAERMGSFRLAAGVRKWKLVLYEKLGMEAETATLRAEIEDAAERHAELRLPTDSFERERRQHESWRHHRFRARIRETIESTPDALFVLDAVRGSTGRVVDLINEFRNAAAHSLCGCAPTDVLTLTQLEAIPEFADLRDSITQAVEHRTTSNDELWLEGPPGRCIARRVVPVGEGVAITLRDATAEREAAIALRVAAERARQADRAKSEFLANMSHEVRTPINGVLGLARLLADTTLDPVQRSYVDGIVSSADILLSVIGDVLDLSKIEAGRVELEATATELAPLVGRVAALFQGQAKAKGLSLSVLVQPSLPRYILADGSRLQQVLANLVGNAVKFTKAGSVEVAVNRLEGRLRFEVRDTGPGIAQGGLDSAFEAFHQASQEARLMGGSGLGLTIARSILQLMGGTIGAVSRVGEGSCFWFELPLIPAEPPTPNQPDAPTTDLKGVRVLLVEDNAVNVMVAGGLLRKAGCEYTVADDGARAVQMVEDQQFGAILMDVRMPGMDGLEATRRIRALERERRTPIIALTASALTDDREECFEAGMDDYLGKPFTEEALRATLSRWVSARACGFPAN